jgi:hypothetical protein
MQREEMDRLISQHPTAGKAHDLDGAVAMCGPLGTFLPARTGPRPVTTPGLPHAQLDQQPEDPAIPAELARRAFGLPRVAEAPSAVSVPGARALQLSGGARGGPPEAFFAGLAGREFAHLHPAPDHSMHMCLPAALARAACEAGWAEMHPLVASGGLPPTVVMIYAPRNQHDLGIAWRLLRASHRFATGQTGTAQPRGTGPPPAKLHDQGDTP